MKIGKISKNEKTIRLELDLNCSNCQKKVPGGIKVSENYSKTDAYKKEIKEFKENYLCGICRDKKRVKGS